MQSFEDILSRLGAQTVLCVGDLMLDEFVYGDVSRISPEAATPVIAVRWQQAEIGGAGNVARNVASLGGRCLFVGVVGDDETGRRLRADLDAEPSAHRVGHALAAERRSDELLTRRFATHAERACEREQHRSRDEIDHATATANLPAARVDHQLFTERFDLEKRDRRLDSVTHEPRRGRR